MEAVEEIAKSYEDSLKELNTISKVEINVLTMLAEENMEEAITIVGCIENHLKTAPKDRKLPILYLVDSICKNCKNSKYIELFTQNIVSNFYNAFKVSDEKVRRSLEKLRKTWGDPNMKIFPQSKLEAIDARVRTIDANWMKNEKFSSQNKHAQQANQPTSVKINQTNQTIIDGQQNQNIITNNQNSINQTRTGGVNLKRPLNNNNTRRNKRVKIANNQQNVSQQPQILQPQTQILQTEPHPILPPESLLIIPPEQPLQILQPDQQHILHQELLFREQQQQLILQEQTQLIQQTQQHVLMQPHQQPLTTHTTTTTTTPAITTRESEPAHSHILDSLYGGKQCSSCSLRFDYDDKYSNHLDWHFRQNSNNVKKVRQRQWYCPLDLWVKFREINDDDLQKNTDSNSENLINEGEVPSAPLFREDEKNICSVCHETFEKFWAEEDEEWRLKNASLYDERVYHPLCLKDMLQAATVTN